MGKGAAPTAPDPYESAAAQYQFGTQAANYNMGLNAVNDVTPFGSTTWSVNPSGLPSNNSGSSQSSPLAPLNKGVPSSMGIPGYNPSGMGGVISGAIGNSIGSQLGSNNSNIPPQYTKTTTLSPAEQQILQAQQSQQIGAGSLSPALLSQASQAIGSGLPNLPAPIYSPGGYSPTQTNLDTSNVQPIIGANDLSGFAQNAQDKSLKGYQAALDPYWNNQQEQLDSSLRNSGAHPGDPAYDNAMSQFQSQRAGAYTQAAGQAVNTGLNAQQTLYGESANTNQQQFQQDFQKLMEENQAAGQTYQEALQNAQQTMTSRGQALTQAGQYAGIPISELQAMTGLTNPSIPGAGSSPQSSVGAPDIMSAFNNAYQGQIANYNAQTGTDNALLGTLGTIAAAFLMA